MDLLLQPLRKYADFQGRASRSEFWLFQLLKWGVLIGVFVVSALLDGILGNQQYRAFAAVFGLILLVWFIGLLIPNLTVSVRRLHDVNQSGWLLLVGIIPFIGPLALFVLFLLPGTAGRNIYGPDPREHPVAPIVEAFS